MLYTYGMAKRSINDQMRSYCSPGGGGSINDALQALASLDGWDRLRQVIRMKVPAAGGVIALPPGAGRLTRACVGGVPAHVRGQDFRFIQNGPGDLSSPPRGFSSVSNVQDLGSFPTMYQTPAAGWLCAATLEGQPPIRVEALDANGYGIVFDLPATATADGGVPEGWTPPEGQPVVTDVTRLVLSPSASAYVNLFWTDGRATSFLSRLHPAVQVPESRRYRVDGSPRGPWWGPGPVDACDVLAEVTIDPLPLVEDTDVLPLPDLQPIRLMIRALWHFESNEPDTGLKYQQMAISWMKANEAKEDLKQTPALINSVLECSGHGISEFCMDL